MEFEGDAEKNQRFIPDHNSLQDFEPVTDDTYMHMLIKLACEKNQRTIIDVLMVARERKELGDIRRSMYVIIENMIEQIQIYKDQTVLEYMKQPITFKAENIHQLSPELQELIKSLDEEKVEPVFKEGDLPLCNLSDKRVGPIPEDDLPEQSEEDKEEIKKRLKK